MTVDKREGFTEKPVKEQGSYTPRDNPKAESRQDIPSQRKAPKGPKTGQ